MTSHHDVAGVVAELRIGFDVSPAIAERAAALLESQAKALSEAERKRDEARDSAAESWMLAFKWMGRHDRIAAGKDGGEYPSPADVPNVLARALAAEARLAEAMRVIEQCDDALSRCYQVTEWPADGTTSQDEALTAARAFTNAAKEKT